MLHDICWAAAATCADWLVVSSALPASCVLVAANSVDALLSDLASTLSDR
jgi:hypothetical protein